MLLQSAGSPFDWRAGRGPNAVRIGALDDATGKVLFLHFRPSEDQVGYLVLLRTIAQRYGLPLRIYHDRPTSLRSPQQPTLAEQLAGPTPMSQLQRVMAELGIESIAAGSPQAKGRIERLWGTLQDRLTQELRLAGSTGLEQAHAFLPSFIARYNARFAQAPQDPQRAWGPLPADRDTHYYCAVRDTRTVRADHCISFAGQLLQRLPGPKAPSLGDQRVSVPTVPEGDIYVYLGKRRIAQQRGAAPQAPHPHPNDEATQPVQPAAPQAKAKARQRAWLFGQH